MTTIGARRLREKLGEKHEGKPGTQADLGRALGVTAQSVGQWVSGETRPATKHMAAIEDLFGIPIRDWLEPDDEAEDPEPPASERVPSGGEKKEASGRVA